VSLATTKDQNIGLWKNGFRIKTTSTAFYLLKKRNARLMALNLNGRDAITINLILFC
jgi:hypothetical protein